MEYELINPPRAYRNFYAATKKEANEYWLWFNENLNIRIEQLSILINKETMFSPDFSINSLGTIDNWLQNTDKITKTNLRAEEIENINKHFLPQFQNRIPVRNFVLSNTSISIGFDVGIYIGQALRHNHPTLYWELYLGKGNEVDYNQPLLMGFKSGGFNPDRTGQVIINKVVDKISPAVVDLYNFRKQFIL